MAKSVRVFISSTFLDMAAERDHLVTIVFPELRERLRLLGIEFYDVDLRWGVPLPGINRDATESWAYCRKCIDETRPFFVGLLGDRYGTLLPAKMLQPSQSDDEHLGVSITELEIRHAITVSQFNSPRSFFLLT